MQHFYGTLVANNANSSHESYFAKLVKLTSLTPTRLNQLATNLYWNEW